ncbi:MAG: DUF2069 domain-containing protein [Xanthomonadaceae bacterium]|jgi:uncharacterized membrane protein|nr:DUF2069 domain-containing protein [Xanthomonadaceae bacterium]
MTIHRDASKSWLAGVLLALAVLYIVWFRNDKYFVASMLVFALPPLLLAPLVLLRRTGRTALMAGVLALFWFSHGVMSAWTQPSTALFAWAEILLSLTAVFLSSWPGLKARFGKNRQE